MLKSMTAYACTEHNEQDLIVNIEIKSYNSRHLDVVLRLPAGNLALEDQIKRIIGERVVRGRIEVRINIKDSSESSVSYDLDLPRARAYHKALSQLRDELQIPATVTLEQVASNHGVIQAVEAAKDTETHMPAIEACLKKALACLDAMRIKEGSFIEKDFRQRLLLIEKGLEHIEKIAKDLPAIYREKLQSRVESIIQGIVELDQTRIVQEAALMAERSDICEEVVRTRSHLEQFRNYMDNGESAGRKLNFLLQELNREFNTMGSKIGQADAAHSIVNIKAELEKLREQIQNIE
ncbi:MAG: YicC family protein [Desulfobacteraceae bacterium]|nr:YicC family protein [Desulfobacteraceae bacterium]